MPHQWPRPHTSPLAGRKGHEEAVVSLYRPPVHGSTPPPPTRLQESCPSSVPAQAASAPPPTQPHGANSCLSHVATHRCPPALHEGGVSHKAFPPGQEQGDAQLWEVPGRGHKSMFPDFFRGTCMGNAEPRGKWRGAGEDPMRVAFGLMEGWASATSHAHIRLP